MLPSLQKIAFSMQRNWILVEELEWQACLLLFVRSTTVFNISLTNKIEKSAFFIGCCYCCCCDIDSWNGNKEKQTKKIGRQADSMWRTMKWQAVSTMRAVKWQLANQWLQVQIRWHQGETSTKTERDHSPVTSICHFSAEGQDSLEKRHTVSTAKRETKWW